MTIINTSSNSSLSPIEKEMILMVSYDYLDAEIAKELPLPIEQIKPLKDRILKKLDAESMPGAIRMAYELKILELCESSF